MSELGERIAVARPPMGPVVSVIVRCSACGAVGAETPPCRHFRRNRAAGYDGFALGRFEAWFVRRKLQPPWWPRRAVCPPARADKRIEP